MIGDMTSLSKLRNIKTRSISPENFSGGKGEGGQAVEGTGASCARDLGKGWKISPSVKIAPGETFTMAEMDGPGMIKHIWVTTSSTQNRTLVFRIYWDECQEPSVETPLGDFFASADEQQYEQLTSLAVCVNPRKALNCYWDMPFYRHCKMTLENLEDEDVIVYYQVDYQLLDLEPGMGYFHAQFRRTNPLPYKQDYTILDGVKGKGQYVGTYLALTALERYWYGEGEIKFYLDGDREYPTICGTGTEDYFGGAWSFATQENGRTVENTYCTPFLGYPYYSVRDTELHNDYHTDDQLPQRGFYRWHIMDPILFQEDLRVTIQQIGVSHGGLFERQDDVASVAYWYQTEPHEPFDPLMERKDRWPR